MTACLPCSIRVRVRRTFRLMTMMIPYNAVAGPTQNSEPAIGMILHMARRGWKEGCNGTKLRNDSQGAGYRLDPPSVEALASFLDGRSSAQSHSQIACQYADIDLEVVGQLADHLPTEWLLARQHFGNG